MAFEAAALVCAAFFAGAASYITLVEHPARLACGPAVALTQWRPSYKRATLVQAPLALIGLFAAAVAFAQGRGLAVLIAGLLLGMVVPITLLVILPTNKQLLDPALDPDSSRTLELLQRWGRLHAIRTVLSILAFAVLLAHLLGYA